MKVMGIFAHPDDEVRALGTLLKHVKRGDNCTIIWATKGERGILRGVETKRIQEIRTNSARRIANQLGADFKFLGIEDCHVERNQKNIKKVVSCIRDFMPDLLITHHYKEAHPDHRELSLIVRDSVFFSQIPLYIDTVPLIKTCSLFFLDVELASEERIFVDITDFFSRKMKLCKVYENLKHEEIELNDRLAGLRCRKKYAESFRTHLGKPRVCDYLE